RRDRQLDGQDQHTVQRDEQAEIGRAQMQDALHVQRKRGLLLREDERDERRRGEQQEERPVGGDGGVAASFHVLRLRRSPALGKGEQHQEAEDHGGGGVHHEYPQ